ncbi:hypothetical protein QJ043_06930 [Olsenella sp. YH-ols2217]|uniref:TadE-like protein n=1 Tax=Kribbibacterium absianum TaxID=3044210 RepID=A0ABT6ZMT7_9ACTN|nr:MULTISPECIES: hypothetical protein [unclassified Olsenella]MDJ1121800.1 hypothetical protein [Olsenella sp. YH-ols2216]MDJ1129808.1 hypothetical protein [Olsenella sp. YH-ols2217]
MRSWWAEERGQAVVELAALLPVVLVVALVAINLGRFLELSARFDRVSLDAALAHGAAPAGEQDAQSACEQAREAIVQALDADDAEVEVRAERLDPVEDGLLAFVPGRVRFVCTLRYRPRPQGFSVAGVPLGAPVALEHTREVVVDVGSVGLGLG